MTKNSTWQCSRSPSACTRLIFPRWSISALGVSLQFIARLQVDQACCWHGRWFTGPPGLGLSTASRHLPVAAPPPSLSPRCSCPFLTALFFIASLLRLCCIPSSPELWRIHLFSSVWHSGENICIVYLEMAFKMQNCLKSEQDLRFFWDPRMHTCTVTTRKRIKFWPSFCAIRRTSGVWSLPKCSKDVELRRAGKAATLLNNSLSHCVCSSSSRFNSALSVWTKT